MKKKLITTAICLVVVLAICLTLFLVLRNSYDEPVVDDDVVEDDDDDVVVPDTVVPDITPDTDDDDIVLAQYLVTFDSNDGTAVQSQAVEAGSTATEPTVSRADFTFAGWYYMGALYDFDSAVVSDITLTAMWYGTETATNGVQYMMSDDLSSYTVVGLASIISTDIDIDAVYKELPVVGVASSAFDGQSTLTSIVVPDSVTVIGAGAFAGCSSLESITLPFVGANISGSGRTYFGYIFGDDSYLKSSSDDTGVPDSLGTVTISGGAIANYAMQYLTNVTTVILGDNVTSIGHHAFYSCSYLHAVVVGQSVDSIGEYAFYYCYQLVQVCNQSQLEIVAGETSHGHIAYYVLQDITDDAEDVDIGKLTVEDDDFVLYSSGDDVIFVEYVGTDSSVVVPDSVTTISSYVFYYNDIVTEVILGDNVTIIGEYTFSVLDNLESVVIGSGIDTISQGAFSDCSKLTTVTISSSVTSIADNAFYGCSRLSSVTLPEGLVSIGRYAFYGCSSLTSIVVPDSVVTIGSGAFRGCSSLASITIPFVGSDIASSGSTGFFGYIFGDSAYLPTINSSTNVPSSLVAVAITGGNIASNAFSYMRYITDITLYSGISSIGYSAFDCCYSLSKVYYAGDICDWCVINFADAKANPMCYADSFYLKGSAVTAITADDLAGVTAIGAYAFGNCVNITSITIPTSVTTIGTGAFTSCSSMSDVYYLGSVAEWCGISFASSTSNPMYSGSNFYIDNSVLTAIDDEDLEGSIAIKAYAFYGFDCLLTVDTGSSVTSIASSAFRNCNNLASVIIGRSVSSISTQVFADCTSLAEIIFADTEGWYRSSSSTSSSAVSVTDSVQNATWLVNTYGYYNSYWLKA